MNSEKEKRYLIGEEDLPIVLLQRTMGKSEDWPRLVEEMPGSFTVAAPTCRVCGAIRLVGMRRARRRARRLRQAALPAHPVR